MSNKFTINLAPDAQCDGNPHTCGLTQPKKPKTPSLDTWNDEHGAELSEFLLWLGDENLLTGVEYTTNFEDRYAAKFLEIEYEDVRRDSERLHAAIEAAWNYAVVHGRPGLLAEFAPEDEDE